MGADGGREKPGPEAVPGKIPAKKSPEEGRKKRKYKLPASDLARFTQKAELNATLNESGAKNNKFAITKTPTDMLDEFFDQENEKKRAAFQLSFKEKKLLAKKIAAMDQKSDNFKKSIAKKKRSNQFRDILKVLTDIDNSAFFNYQEDKQYR